MNSKNALFEMANFRERSTGISYTIWVSNKTGKEKHGPRIKVQHTTSKTINYKFDFITISISDTPEIKAGKRNINKIKPKELEKINNWIILNKEYLLDYWYNNIDTAELSEKLKKI